jgi:hypothetical protein
MENFYVQDMNPIKLIYRIYLSYKADIMSITKTITDLIKVSIEAQMNTFISAVSEKYEINQDELIEMFKDIGKETLTISKKAAKKAKIKTPKPRSAWLMFSGETGKLIRENPEKYNVSSWCPFGDITKKCGELWRGMDDDEKAPWQEKADEYNTEHVGEVHLKKISKPKSQRGKANKTEKKPKTQKIRSAWLMFSGETGRLIRENPDNYDMEEGFKFGDVTKKCGELWRGMDDDEKAPWQEKADEYNSGHIDDTPVKKKISKTKKVSKTKTAYQNFMTANKKWVKDCPEDYELSNNASGRVIATKCKEIWNELNDHEKARWTTEKMGEVSDGEVVEEVEEEVDEEVEKKTNNSRKNKQRRIKRGITKRV